MDIWIFQSAIVASVLIFFVPKNLKYWMSSIVMLTFIGITSLWAIDSLSDGGIIEKELFIEFWGQELNLVIDPLSAFFILVVNFTVLTGFIYAKGYLNPYLERKNSIEIGLHYLSLLWLHLSMLLVAMIRDGYVFLVVWELMSISSFILVIFDSEKKETIKSGINYLIQMHIGFIFILVGFIISSISSNTAFGFDGLMNYFESHDPFSLFLLFFIGFGIKAGFIPFHSWLPHAHPAAPSHVSGIMSGVMIKMGIYGILRVLTYIRTDLLVIGYFILAISLISGLLGVMYAIVQHDIKKLLAYHSIENIGIIGIGIGLGTIGIALNVPLLAVLGFAGGILHILNHSLFKSLLFYSAGSVYRQTHTKYIEHLGGLIKTMPKSALLFLLGAMAICGLPPFNGFISEFLIFSGMFKGLQTGGVYVDITILFALSGLALIGGLAIFCFTKIFGIMFLGTPRSDDAAQASEVESSMIVPQVMIALVIVSIGFFPMVFINPIRSILDLYNVDTVLINQSIPAFEHISMGSAFFIGIALLLWLVKKSAQKKQSVIYGPTWGCGYTGANPKVHQYTASSFADSFAELTNPIVGVEKKFTPVHEKELFPDTRKFETHSHDAIEKYLVRKPTGRLMQLIGSFGALQTGNIRHYVLYGVFFILLIFCLTLLNLI